MQSFLPLKRGYCLLNIHSYYIEAHICKGNDSCLLLHLASYLTCDLKTKDFFKSCLL